MEKNLIIPTKLEGPYQILDFDITHPDVLIVHPGKLTGYPQLFQLEYAFTLLTTTAAVASRYVYLSSRKGPYGLITANQLITNVRSDDVPASQTDSQWQFNSAIIATSGYGTEGTTGYARPIPVQGDDYIYIFLSSGQNGDNLRGNLQFKYLNRELGMFTPEMIE